MRNLLFFICLLLAVPTTYAQPEIQYTSTAESDPQAKVMLDKMKKKYDSYKSLEADIVLTLSIPEQPVEIQKGHMAQAGEKYRVALEKQSVYCNGNAIWFYQSDVNEVQINDAADVEDDENALTPNKLMRIYENDDYIYALANAYTEDGQPVQEIEFKPVDKDSEYSKIRLKLNKRSYHPMSILVFSKDGSRFELDISNIKTNQTYASNYWNFDAKDFDGVHVEDLRID